MNDNSNKVVTVIQARTGSTRLPGKIMKEVCGKPVLELLIERVQRAKLAGTIVVATTMRPEDDDIAGLCSRVGINCSRGSQFDLLERHYKAAKKFDADVVVKVPSDCPLIDPEVIDNVIGFFLNSPGTPDYAGNLHPATYPDGNDVEVFTMNALFQAYYYAIKDYEREHTTPFIWDNPEIFKTANVLWETGNDLSNSHRFVLDYPEDLEFIRRVYEELYPVKHDFTLNDILLLLEKKPEIHQINSHLNGLNWYSKHLNDFKTYKRA
jgi:spore coat polysaccharide biosynthesis protein SpsF